MGQRTSCLVPLCRAVGNSQESIIRGGGTVSTSNPGTQETKRQEDGREFEAGLGYMRDLVSKQHQREYKGCQRMEPRCVEKEFEMARSLENRGREALRIHRVH